MSVMYNAMIRGVTIFALEGWALQ